MWSVDRIADDLNELGVLPGTAVLVHASMRSIGPVESGAMGLLAALRSAVGPDGTIAVPTFTPQFRDPAEWQNPPESGDDIDAIRAQSTVFDIAQTPSLQPAMGIFSEVLRTQPEALRSHHPLLSFSAIGALAPALVKNAPLHYPLGSESLPARLHDANGEVLLIGVEQDVNVSIHLAEIWAGAPYAHRSCRVKTAPDTWVTMQGSPECRDGFIKLEVVLRQARILKRGYVGNAIGRLMKQRELVSMAIAMLQGSAESLLCSNPGCKHCTQARQFTRREIRSEIW